MIQKAHYHTKFINFNKKLTVIYAIIDFVNNFRFFSPTIKILFTSSFTVLYSLSVIKKYKTLRMVPQYSNKFCWIRFTL